MSKKGPIIVGIVIAGLIALLMCCGVGAFVLYKVKSDDSSTTAPAKVETPEPGVIAVPPPVKPTAIITPGNNNGKVQRLAGQRPQKFPVWGTQGSEVSIAQALLIVSDASLQAQLGVKFEQYIYFGNEKMDCAFPGMAEVYDDTNPNNGAITPLVWCGSANAVAVFPRAYAEVAQHQDAAVMFKWYGMAVYMAVHSNQRNFTGEACFTGKLIRAFEAMQVITADQAKAALTYYARVATEHPSETAWGDYAKYAGLGYLHNVC